MRTLDASVEALYGQRYIRWVRCWKIERKDGTTYHLTDHNKPIEYDGDTYSPAGGFDSAAYQASNTLDPANSDYRGIITSDVIKEEDLRAGRYHEAKITCFLIDWKYPWAGVFNEQVFWISTVEHDEIIWRADVEGLGRYLRIPRGRLLNRNCPYVLGDSRCNASIFTLVTSINSIVDARRVFRTSGTGGSDGVYDNGKVVFTSGNNSGLTFEIKTYTVTNEEFTLQVETPFDMQAGDGIQITAGCDKTIDDCKNKFSNLINFGGFHFIPGTDRMLSVPKPSA